MLTLHILFHGLLYFCVLRSTKKAFAPKFFGHKIVFAGAWFFVGEKRISGGRNILE